MGFARFADVFFPLLAVMNPLPVLPVILAQIEDVPEPERPHVYRQAFLTAGGVGLAFAFGGGLILRSLSLTLPDIRVAGGLILLTFAIHDLLFSRRQRKENVPEVGAGVVPLGVPILMGPASMTALLVFSETRGTGWVVLSLALNLLLGYAIVHRAERLTHRVGAPAVRALGKAMGVFLAAVAVSMIRLGIEGMLGTRG